MPTSDTATMGAQHLRAMKQQHPAWLLLSAHNSPWVVAFLHQTFVVAGKHALTQDELTNLLDDELFRLRDGGSGQAEELGITESRTAGDYLAYWSDDARGWLRRFYEEGDDDPHYELTPGTQRAITWVQSLGQRAFVGTESRLRLLIELLRDMSHGGSENREERLRNLLERREAIDAEIQALEDGHIALMSSTEMVERFEQFRSLSRGLIADFREVEQNFRELDRQVRERIANWEGAKGGLLDEILGQRNAIAESDQGRSFFAFFHLLMDLSEQERVEALLDQVLGYEPVRVLEPDPRMRYLIGDWLTAGIRIQRMVARLSKQLARFVEQESRHEERRVLDIIAQIERTFYATGDESNLPTMTIDGDRPELRMPCDRPLFQPGGHGRVEPVAIEAGAAQNGAEALFDLSAVDPILLGERLSEALREHGVTSLQRVVAANPLEHGLGELLQYLHLCEVDPRFDLVDDDTAEDVISWDSADETTPAERQARMRRVIISDESRGPA